ncbi:MULTISPECIES: DsbA family protein [unclassified Microbacterium]|uniref:DsbA family protein n=1 Tax=unclassified Microbacterium TaxID=2609290 RepID=UPI00214AFFE8|nr:MULTISPECIES: DsbA family protein [unclassified Microbacterium]MCR2784931.1 DsbA family protein [Microbacterium sp. zg.B96]WIM16470.1 DsbA family protein [Microbacterium sp. zg-B96]
MASAGNKTNWFAVWVSAAVVVVLVGVGALVWWMNSAASPEASAPTGSSIEAETGAIVVGDGADEVELWMDFYCPHCQDFEDAYGSTISELVDSNAITLRVQPVALASLNAASGTEFSARSASAMYCVAETSGQAAYDFMTAVFATHPTGQGLTDDELAQIAADAGAPDAAECIADETYADFVLSQAQELPESPEGSAGTPTLLVNGEYVTITGDVTADLTSRLGM